MTGWLSILVVAVLLPFAVFSEPDRASTHTLERPPNESERAASLKETVSNFESEGVTYKELLILPTPFGAHRSPAPTEDPVPTATPTAVPLPLYAQPKITPAIDAAVAACELRPDRYDWQTYALGAGFPPEVVASAEMARLINTESAGDLCAVNTSSQAACWAQILSSAGEAQQIAYLDPVECMAAAYAKWRDGGGSFERHWFRFWVTP